MEIRLGKSYTFTDGDDGIEIKQGSTHTVYMKAKDSVGNVVQSDSDAKVGKKENVQVIKVPGGNDKNPDNPAESIITFSMKVGGQPWSAQKGEGTNWTNQDVTVEVKHSAGAGYVIQTKRPGIDDDWQEYSAGVLMQKNGAVYARLKEINGTQTSETYATFNLGVIDKALPELSHLSYLQQQIV